MIKHLDQETKKRVNKAIANIRLIATRVKRANVLDATQRAEIVVNLLNEFRQYVNVYEFKPDMAGVSTPFKHDHETLERVVQATFQADTIFSFLTREKKKTYDEEYRQAWNLLENIHTYLSNIVEKGVNHA